MMEIKIGNIVVDGGKQFLVTRLDVGGGVHGRRCTDAEPDFFGRDVLLLGTAEDLEKRGAAVAKAEGR